MIGLYVPPSSERCFYKTCRVLFLKQCSSPRTQISCRIPLGTCRSESNILNGHRKSADLRIDRILFWRIDEDLYNAKQLVRDAHLHTNTARQRNMPEEDMKALEEAFRHL